MDILLSLARTIAPPLPLYTLQDSLEELTVAMQRELHLVLFSAEVALSNSEVFIFHSHGLVINPASCLSLLSILPLRVRGDLAR